MYIYGSNERNLICLIIQSNFTHQLLSGCVDLYLKTKMFILFTQPLRSGRIWHKVNI